MSVWTETLSEVTPGDSKLDYDKRANHVYGKACEMLVKVVNCLQVSFTWSKPLLMGLGAPRSRFDTSSLSASIVRLFEGPRQIRTLKIWRSVSFTPVHTAITCDVVRDMAWWFFRRESAPA